MIINVKRIIKEKEERKRKRRKRGNLWINDPKIERFINLLNVG